VYRINRAGQKFQTKRSCRIQLAWSAGDGCCLVGLGDWVVSVVTSQIEPVHELCWVCPQTRVCTHVLPLGASRPLLVSSAPAYIDHHLIIYRPPTVPPTHSLCPNWRNSQWSSTIRKRGKRTESSRHHCRSTRSGAFGTLSTLLEPLTIEWEQFPRCSQNLLPTPQDRRPSTQFLYSLQEGGDRVRHGLRQEVRRRPQHHLDICALFVV
jgi:hypothetical protein